MRGLLTNVRKTIENFSMLDRGDHVLVAVSGGPDSVVLLKVLSLLAAEYRLRLTVAHLNHGLRGGEADNDETFVRQLSEEMGIECITRKVDIRALQKGRGRSLEEIGRPISG
jgi:tRNA(Ile)-lysidine synthase